ncbi:MAG: hypothetical protein KTU85_12760 [Acidimicrobiia bacterium]|nr:hypothetical protein [Acidimicrobiia bacterium]
MKCLPSATPDDLPTAESKASTSSYEPYEEPHTDSPTPPTTKTEASS